MKISEGFRMGRDAMTAPRERTAPGSSSFQQLMTNQQNRLSTDHLQRLLGEIEQQAERLGKHRTVEELRSYKELVRKFVQEAVTHGVGLEEKQGFPFRGKEKRFKILTELDEQLLTLTKELLDEQEPMLTILERVGEIKGLLLNLYF